MGLILFPTPKLSLESMWQEGEGHPGKVYLYVSGSRHLNKLVRAFPNITDKEIEDQAIIGRRSHS